ncbi:unnamed protein product [Ixodes pacificus]
MSLLPPFPAFIVHADHSTVGTRYRKWVTRFRNFLVACNITAPGRSKAMLLHYAGDDVNDIFESLCDTTVAAAPSTSSSPSTTTASTPAAAANKFKRAIEALTLHFQPRCNVEHERFLFAKRGSLRTRASPSTTRVYVTLLADADSLTSTVRLSHKSSKRARHRPCAVKRF